MNNCFFTPFIHSFYIGGKRAFSKNHTFPKHDVSGENHAFFKITDFSHFSENHTFFKNHVFSKSHFFQKYVFFPSMTSLEKFTLFFQKHGFFKFMLFGEIRVLYNLNIIKRLIHSENFKQKSWLQTH